MLILCNDVLFVFRLQWWRCTVAKCVKAFHFPGRQSWIVLQQRLWNSVWWLLEWLGCSCSVSWYAITHLVHAMLYIYPFSSGPGLALKGRDNIFGPGNISIVLDNVVCQGTESDLLMCQHSDTFQSNCDHTEDAAIICGGESWQFWNAVSRSPRMHALSVAIQYYL